MYRIVFLNCNKKSKFLFENMALLNILKNSKNRNFNKIIIKEKMGLLTILVGEPTCMYRYSMKMKTSLAFRYF